MQKRRQYGLSERRGRGVGTLVLSRRAADVLAVCWRVADLFGGTVCHGLALFARRWC